jgi:hypothetical protein
MKFFLVRSKDDWNSHDFKEHLKKRYSSTRWSFKWAAFNNLKMLSYESSIANLESKILNILIELKSQNSIIEQIVTLKVLNILESSFFIYLIVLIKSTCKKSKFSILISLFQNLANEENRQRTKNVINLIRQKEVEINRNIIIINSYLLCHRLKTTHARNAIYFTERKILKKKKNSFILIQSSSRHLNDFTSFKSWVNDVFDLSTRYHF